MSQIARHDRLLKASSSEYRYMDNATFDLRSAALGWLAARDRMAVCPEPEYNAASGAEWNAREALYTAFDNAGLDRDLLKRLGLYL
jgi:hypothetical protein